MNPMSFAPAVVAPTRDLLVVLKKMLTLDPPGSVAGITLAHSPKQHPQVLRVRPIHLAVDLGAIPPLVTLTLAPAPGAVAGVPRG